MSDRDLTIGELAKRTGVATSALRYYEELGLLPAPVRVSGSGATRSQRSGSCLTTTSRRELAQPHPTQARRPRRTDRQGQTAKEALTHALHCPHDDITTCPRFTSTVAARSPVRPWRKPTSTELPTNRVVATAARARPP
jgi:MerR family regulatory protein